MARIIKEKQSEIHPKLLQTIKILSLNQSLDMPFYGEFLNGVNIYNKTKDPKFKTAAVWVSPKGMNLGYNTDFLDTLNQEQMNFLVIHELFHLLFNHPARTQLGGYDPELSNIAQDMIINYLIVRDIKPDFVDIPKDELGRNSALFIPDEYPGDESKYVFELVYHWLKEKREDNTIFGDLYCIRNRPLNSEITADFKHSSIPFFDMLEEKSKRQAQKYMRNFTRKVLVSIMNGKEVKLFGHTSTVSPDGETKDYNKKLSERRANIFKLSVKEHLDDFMDTFVHAKVIVEHESQTFNQQQLVDYCMTYEEVVDNALKLQRSKELNAKAKEISEDGSTNRLKLLFEQYRMAELTKFNVKRLQQELLVHRLQRPNVQNEKVKIFKLYDGLVTAEGKGDTDLIITNDWYDEKAELADKYAKDPKYKFFVNLENAEDKQKINRRITFEFDDDMNDGEGDGNSAMSQKGSGDNYGENGKNGQECFDTDGIFEQAQENDGMFLDQHVKDEGVSPEHREQIINEKLNELRQRGRITSDIEKTLEGLRKKKKDYTKELKRSVLAIKGPVKHKTIVKPNRRSIKGLKGKKKIGYKINCILDCSGSMSGYVEKGLNFIFRNDIQINLMIADTEIKCEYDIKTMKDLETKVSLHGFGGTCMQPAFNHIADNPKLNKFNTMLITDGYTDTLDFSRMRGKVLILTCGEPCPISGGAEKVKQIVIPHDEWFN